MPEIKLLSDFKEKQKTRLLYEKIFRDSKEFTDYYYADKCRDNKIVVLENKGEIISMAHINPYLLSVCGHQINGYYIVAVATDEKYRHRGFMKLVMNKVFKVLKSVRAPFCHLLPINPDIYKPLGFQKICDFVIPQKDDYEIIKTVYDIYCVRDENYIRRQTIQRHFNETEGLYWLPKNPIIMAKIIDIAEARRILSLCEDKEERDILEQMRKSACYFREEV